MDDVIGVSEPKEEKEHVEFVIHAFLRATEPTCAGCVPSGTQSNGDIEQRRRRFVFRIPESEPQTVKGMKQFLSLFNTLLFSGAGRKRPRKLVVVVNPFSGQRSGNAIYEKSIRPLLEQAHIEIDYHETASSEHAFDIAKDLSIDDVDGIVGVGGDGLLNQLLHGIMRRADAKRVLTIPLGLIPAGSQNALAISVNGFITPEEHTFNIIRGETKGLDIIDAYNQDTDEHNYALITVALGMIGDILEESENHRWMGPTRYQYSAVKQFFQGSQLKYYKAKVSYLPPGSSDDSSAWQTLDTEEFYMLHAFNVSAETTQTARQCHAECDDGVITLLILKKCSRMDTLSFLIQMESGTHALMDVVQIVQAKSVNIVLSPTHSSPVNIDGELHNAPSTMVLNCLQSFAKMFVAPPEQAPDM